MNIKSYNSQRQLTTDDSCTRQSSTEKVLSTSSLITQRITEKWTRD